MLWLSDVLINLSYQEIFTTPFPVLPVIVPPEGFGMEEFPFVVEPPVSEALPM
jgi:hypothetical protein